MSVKTRKVYKDAIEDIKERKLTEEERFIELERAIEARMEGCEDPNEILKKLKIKRIERQKKKLNC